MNLKEIENVVIDCIRKNIEDSEEKIPDIEPSTGIFTDISGFDSLRAIEVLVTLEDKFGRELMPDDIFVKEPLGSDRVCDVATAIKAIVDENVA